MIRIYISGPVTNNSNFKEDFEKAEKYLKEKYPKKWVVNPCKIPMGNNPTYADFMRADIKELLRCDAIYMLTGWTKSKGAKCEYRIAKCLDFEILYEGKE